jgi:hypothetical protein
MQSSASLPKAELGEWGVRLDAVCIEEITTGEQNVAL